MLYSACMSLWEYNIDICFPNAMSGIIHTLFCSIKIINNCSRYIRCIRHCKPFHIAASPIAPLRFRHRRSSVWRDRVNLSNRKQYVKLGRHRSVCVSCIFSVPRRLVLGSIRFALFVSLLGDHVTSIGLTGCNTVNTSMKRSCFVLTPTFIFSDRVNEH